MFTDEQTQTQIHADLNQSVIRATLRPQDLLPAFLEVIQETPEYAQLMNAVPSQALEDDDAEWWESEDCAFLLNEILFNTLNNYVPEGYYFGAHEGDGSDFGYWQCEDYFRDKAIKMVNYLVEKGLIPDCTDTDNETEFEFQDAIEEYFRINN